MIVVIIAGGSGTRLWPLSTHNYPKHLLSLTNERSLLQNTFERVKKVASLNNILIISEVSHVDQVKKQLPEMAAENVLTEPGRRGTSSCVAWALVEIEKRGYDKTEPILFLWADHLIEATDGFVATALKAGELARQEKSIVFIGAHPSYPAVGFGYIKRGKKLPSWDESYEFDKFVEKPDKKTAETYFKSGQYLWNLGYLTGTLEVFLSNFKEYSPDMLQRYKALKASDDIEKTYLGLESIAVEYVFSEKIKNALVIPGSFDWMDVGSFNDLHSVNTQDDEGNHIKGENIALEETTNSYIHNDTKIPTAVIGLDNVVVVNSKNGILVANKNYSHKVGDVAKRLQSN